MDIGALQCGAENVARKLCVDKGATRVCLGMKVCGEGVSCEALAGVSVRAARRVHGGACSAGLRVWSARLSLRLCYIVGFRRGAVGVVRDYFRSVGGSSVQV